MMVFFLTKLSSRPAWLGFEETALAPNEKENVVKK